MELQILVSKKGTKVVTATNLHMALELNSDHYAVNTKRWLSDVYEFSDGEIRRPLKLKDYAPRKNNQTGIVEDYYISIELAKLITLNSKSKVKLKYAKWLRSLEDKVESGEVLTKEQVTSALELARAMSSVSCQEKCERQHLKAYESRNGGEANNWWKYRERILGYSSTKLKAQMKVLGQKTYGKNQRQMLMLIDKYEVIRTGVIDLFMGMEKTERYAKNMGDLAKLFAKELQIEIIDDRAFATTDLFGSDQGLGLVRNLTPPAPAQQLRVAQS